LKPFGVVAGVGMVETYTAPICKGGCIPLQRKRMMDIFIIGLGAIIVVLSALVIRKDNQEKQHRLEQRIREVKNATEIEWDEWAKVVEELITCNAPPEEREWRLKQFYRDNPRPGATGRIN
jgi:hypothetical protein